MLKGRNSMALWATSNLKAQTVVQVLLEKRADVNA
jgi:hypothetical protein